MPWQCRLREQPDWKAGERPQVGEMWFDSEKLSEDCPAFMKADLSAEYYRDWAGHRAPLILTVPALSRAGYRCIPLDEHYSNQPPNGHGWTIVGEVPAITVNPSINAVGDYHGWLQNGVLSDDVEGRTYHAGGSTAGVSGP